MVLGGLGHQEHNPCVLAWGLSSSFLSQSIKFTPLSLTLSSMLLSESVCDWFAMWSTHKIKLIRSLINERFVLQNFDHSTLPKSLTEILDLSNEAGRRPTTSFNYVGRDHVPITSHVTLGQSICTVYIGMPLSWCTGLAQANNRSWVHHYRLTDNNYLDTARRRTHPNDTSVSLAPASTSALRRHTTLVVTKIRRVVA